MNYDRLRKTIMVAFFVSIAAQIRLNVLTEGFIVALSVMVMAIFIYCYEDLSAAYIACLSGIFSPLFRIIVTYVQEGDLVHVLALVMPDVAFFFMYALVYTLIYKFVIREPKTMKNFPYVVFFSDMLSNVVEMTVRSILAGHNLVTPEMVSYLAVIALIRTAMIMMVVISIEAYSRFLVDKERDEEYKRLLLQASTIEAEMRLLKKNVEEVESVTKTAYEHYHRIRDMNLPTDVVNQALNIAKNSHEIKGDYQNVLAVLQETYMEGLDNEALTIGEIVALERANIQTMCRRQQLPIEIVGRVRADFLVPQGFKMMSILRNLLTNAAEAIGDKGGRIVMTVSEVRKKDGGGHQITVWDNGPGIPEENMESLFLEGFSTKFDLKTGNIQRGLGLCLVKDYVENDFGGRLTIDSVVGEYTQFTIWLPD